jgi:hypothetical protein
VISFGIIPSKKPSPPNLVLRKSHGSKPARSFLDYLIHPNCSPPPHMYTPQCCLPSLGQCRPCPTTLLEQTQLAKTPLSGLPLGTEGCVLQFLRGVKLGRTYVRGNMDSIAICILRRAICILQKFLGNMDTSSKPFLFRRKESILHLDPYCRAIWILFPTHR